MQKMSILSNGVYLLLDAITMFGAAFYEHIKSGFIDLIFAGTRLKFTRLLHLRDYLIDMQNAIGFVVVELFGAIIKPKVALVQAK